MTLHLKQFSSEVAYGTKAVFLLHHPFGTQKKHKDKRHAYNVM